MIDQITLFNKISSSNSNNLVIKGLDQDQWSFLNLNFNKVRKDSLFLFETDEKAYKYYSKVKRGLNNVYFFSDHNQNIYSSIIPSQNEVFSKFGILNSLANDPKEGSFTIICSLKSYFQLVPPKLFFINDKFEISISDIISPDLLAEKLVNYGYSPAPTVEEAGTFTRKGEIFDIFPLNHKPIRIHYFDDMIEEIFIIDKSTLKTLRNEPLEKLTIPKSPYSLLSDELILNFRNNYPRPSFSEKELFQQRESILKGLNSGRLFEDYPLFISYFFKNNTTLSDYTKNFQIYLFDNTQAFENLVQSRDELYHSYASFKETNTVDIKPEPSKLYNFSLIESFNSFISINNLDIEVNLDINLDNLINLQLEDLITSKFLSKNLSGFELLHELLIEYTSKKYHLYISYINENTKLEIINFLNLKEFPLNKVSFYNFDLENGFIYESEKMVVVSENDLFRKKIKKTKSSSRNNNDLFADQISTLKEGDYVIHKEFGVGKYLGIETLELNNTTSDYLVLEYKDSDKVYVPVYRLNLVQKHSSKDSIVIVSNLKTKKFDAAKAKAKGAVKKLAFNLLELQAKRKLLDSYSFSPPDQEYFEFCRKFKFQETPDQLKAIEDVLEDMQSNRPMDRLICGDVGFGKTEVAMRASLKAVLDNKQVCVLVPTTVLAYQHFNSFIERFKDFPVQIDYISRFRTTKEKNAILSKLNEGKIDIIIGTHTLLSDKVKFDDLGLMVIDEEQRFGVGHKEKLKLMRETIDTLTLSATPIPRTLQMSFLGIKDLSIIQTAPPKRQSIKTYLIKEDPSTLKSAIEKEINRGGQVFIIHNKVSDIEIFTSKIRNLVPKAKIIFAHGQLPERDLEVRIKDFYNKKYDILISTTIIESGIDIPSANTMIIDRADTFGLSQLHQLRGRIGRSDKKAYAYFMLPQTNKISDIASKRLKALQTYAELGSGFALASSDLEIRGSGDVLGAEQSGHIGNIGLELYMELLQDALNEIKGNTKLISKKLEIQTPFDAYIPKTYIENDGIRLKYYKKISNCTEMINLEPISDELFDLYGKQPKELNNLLLIMQSKILLQEFALQSIKVKSKKIDLKFDQNLITTDPELQNKILSVFMKRPKVYKLNPDFSINCTFKETISIDSFIDFAKHIAEQIHTC